MLGAVPYNRLWKSGRPKQIESFCLVTSRFYETVITVRDIGISIYRNELVGTVKYEHKTAVKRQTEK